MTRFEPVLVKKKKRFCAMCIHIALLHRVLDIYGEWMINSFFIGADKLKLGIDQMNAQSILGKLSGASMMKCCAVMSESENAEPDIK